MLLGFSLLIPFAFDSLNTNVAPKIYEATKSISLPCFVGASIDFISFLQSLVIAYILIRKVKRKVA